MSAGIRPRLAARLGPGAAGAVPARETPTAHAAPARGPMSLDRPALERLPEARERAHGSRELGVRDRPMHGLQDWHARGNGRDTPREERGRDHREMNHSPPPLQRRARSRSLSRERLPRRRRSRTRSPHRTRPHHHHDDPAPPARRDTRAEAERAEPADETAEAVPLPAQRRPLRSEVRFRQWHSFQSLRNHPLYTTTVHSEIRHSIFFEHFWKPPVGPLCSEVYSCKWEYPRVSEGPPGYTTTTERDRERVRLSSGSQGAWRRSSTAPA